MEWLTEEEWIDCTIGVSVESKVGSTLGALSDAYQMGHIYGGLTGVFGRDEDDPISRYDR